MKLAHQTLREHGIPCTVQRKLILKSLRGNRSHPDVESVHQSLRKDIPALSLDTVYRTLALFAERGLARKLPLPTYRTHYDGVAAAHDHFFCEKCGKVLDVESFTDNHPDSMKPHEDVASVGSMQRLYLGICAACDAIEKDEQS